MVMLFSWSVIVICKLCDRGMLTVLFAALLLVNRQLIFLICLHLIHSERYWFNRKSPVCASSWGKQKKVTLLTLRK